MSKFTKQNYNIKNNKQKRKTVNPKWLEAFYGQKFDQNAPPQTYSLYQIPL